MQGNRHAHSARTGCQRAARRLPEFLVNVKKGFTMAANPPISNESRTEAASGSPTTSPAPAAADMLEPLVQGAHAGIDRLAETAAPHVQRLQDGVAAASDTLREKTDAVRVQGEAWAEDLRDTVREHPLRSIAAAAAVGWLIGRLVR
jgi:ElaB/YqjD/DUF883 family membrane-anchored ribosome-binding protein